MPPYRKAGCAGRGGRKKNKRTDIPNIPTGLEQVTRVTTFRPSTRCWWGGRGCLGHCHFCSPCPSAHAGLHRHLSWPGSSALPAREAPGPSHGLSSRSDVRISREAMVGRVCTLAAVCQQLHPWRRSWGSSVCPCRAGHATTRGLSTRESLKRAKTAGRPAWSKTALSQLPRAKPALSSMSEE